MKLTPAGSQATLSQVNTARAGMSGINQKPLPAGDVTVHNNGRLTVNAAGGRQYGVRNDGSVSSYHDASKTVTFNRAGQVSSVKTANLSVHQGVNGQRTIVSHGPNGSTVVSTGAHSGYMQRNVTIGNHTYIQRTTIVNQRVVTTTYVGYQYHGVFVNRYVTPVFYSPAYYGWAYYPWASPMGYYAWDWMDDPWYGGPGPYFAVYPGYPGAAFWLTDYMIGQALTSAYQMRAEAAVEADDYVADASAGASLDVSAGADLSASASAPAVDESVQAAPLQAEAATPLSPEIKDAIAEEIKAQLTYDSAAASAQVQPASQVQSTGSDELSSVLGQPNRVFIVSSNLDVTTTDQRPCGLQAGDTLRLVTGPTSTSTNAQLRVASSKKLDCPAGTVVAMSLPDLAEMQNNFRAQVESGLAALRAHQGQGGLPSAPQDAMAGQPRQNSEGVAPIPAADVNAALEAQRQQADQVEADAAATAFAGNE